MVEAVQGVEMHFGAQQRQLQQYHNIIAILPKLHILAILAIQQRQL